MRDAKPDACVLPKSGEILHRLVHAFRLHEPAVGGTAAEELTSTNVRRFFRGEWMPDEARQDLCETVARAAIASGMLGSLLTPKKVDGTCISAEKIVAPALYHWLHIWDSVFCATVSGWPGVPSHLAAIAVGRLVVVDLAVRLSALQKLSNPTWAMTDASRWAVPDFGRAFLWALLQSIHPTKSRDAWLKNALGDKQVFRGLDINPRTLDHWIDDSEVPDDENLRKIAQSAASSETEQQTLLRSLRLHYGAFTVSQKAAGPLGWEWVGMMAIALQRLVARARERTSGGHATEDGYIRDQAMCVINGVAVKTGQELAQYWLASDSRSIWSEDLRAIAEDRMADRLNACLRAISDWPRKQAQMERVLGRPVPRQVEERIALWLMDDGVLPDGFADWLAANRARAEIAAGGPAELEAAVCAELATRGSNEERWGDAVGYWERVVQLQPECSNSRFHYGCCLWHVRRWDEGVAQLCEACRLKPDWDMPFVEIAILYLNRGRGEPGPMEQEETESGLVVCREASWTSRALQHIDSEGARFEASSARYNHKRGEILWRLAQEDSSCRQERLSAALQSLLKATSIDPKSGQAWDLAAECAFLLGRRIDGRKYAKKALDLGFRTAHDKWNV